MRSRIYDAEQLKVARKPAAATIFLHLAMATAIFAIAEIQFIPRPVALGTGLIVAVLGVMFFRARTHPLLWVFPVAMALTALWSPDPAFTIISVGGIVIPILLAGAVVQVARPDQFIRALALWSRVALILSFAVFVLRPELGAHQDALYDGAMRGLFAHKNGLARILVIGVFAEIFIAQRRSSRFFWLGAFLAAALLTRSLSFFVLIGAIILIAAVLGSVKWRNPRSVIVFVGIAHIAAPLLILFAVLVGPDLVAESGRFSAEDDRGRIWRGVVSLFQMKPLGGWGYGQVFRPETDAGQYILAATGWIPTAAHSGYMNALAEGGLLGLAALVVSLIGAVVVAWKARKNLLWPAVYAVVLTINNITDSRSASVEWFILAAGVLYASHRNAESTAHPFGAIRSVVTPSSRFLATRTTSSWNSLG